MIRAPRILLLAFVWLALGSTASVWAQTPGESAPSLPDGRVQAGRTTITLPDTNTYSPLERQVLALERARSAAIAKGDTVWLATLYAPDFSGIAAFGLRIDRSDLFKVFGRDDPEHRFMIDELAVRDYGGSVLVTGRLQTLGGNGEPMPGGTRYLHVYVKRANRWWLVRAQATKIMTKN